MGRSKQNGYYLTDPGSLVTFPRADRPGSVTRTKEDTDIIHETEEGILWVYPQIRRGIWELNFRVDEEDLDVFETLHDAVNGIETQFYYVPDVDNVSTAYLVRKEQGFAPKEVDQQSADGVVYYDYTLKLRGESAAAIEIGL